MTRNRPNRHDPYVAFKNDRERRIALTVRCVCGCIATVVLALCAEPSSWEGRIRWLMSLFH